MIVEPSKGGYDGVEVPDGLYAVACTKIEETILANDQYGKTDKFRLTLAGATPDGEPFIVEPLLNQAWSEKANLFLFAVAFGLDPDPNEPFDTDAFIGKKAQAFVVTAEEAGSWPRVQTISRIKSKAPAASTTPTAASMNGGIGLPQSSRVVGDTGADIDGFWRRVKAVGLDRSNIAPFVDNDLTTLAQKSQADLDHILAEVGA